MRHKLSYWMYDTLLVIKHPVQSRLQSRCIFCCLLLDFFLQIYFCRVFKASSFSPTTVMKPTRLNVDSTQTQSISSLHIRLLRLSILFSSICPFNTIQRQTFSWIMRACVWVCVCVCAFFYFCVGWLKYPQTVFILIKARLSFCWR